MSKYLLVVDSDCAECSELGRYLREHTDQIKIIGATDAAASGLVASLAEPVLLELDTGGSIVKSYRGARMRLKIARTLGVRKWSMWPTFAFLESKANDVRGGSPLRRRTLILGSLAAAAGAVGAGMFGAQSAAAGGLVSARSVDVGVVLARSRTARRAASQHGAVMSAEVVSQGGRPSQCFTTSVAAPSRFSTPRVLRIRPLSVCVLRRLATSPTSWSTPQTCSARHGSTARTSRAPAVSRRKSLRPPSPAGPAAPPPASSVRPGLDAGPNARTAGRRSSKTPRAGRLRPSVSLA